MGPQTGLASRAPRGSGRAPKGGACRGEGAPKKRLSVRLGGAPAAAHPGGSRRPVTTNTYLVRGPWAPKPGSPRAHLEPWGVRQRGWRAGARAPPKSACRSGWGAPRRRHTQVARVGRLRPTHISCEARGPPNRAPLARTSSLGVCTKGGGVPGRGRPQKTLVGPVGGAPAAAHPGGSRRPVTTKKYFVRGPWAPKPGSPRAHLEPPGVRQRGRRAGARAPPNQMPHGLVGGATARRLA